MYRWRPVTMSRPFTLATGCPATVQRVGGVIALSSPTDRASFWPLVSSPKAAARRVGGWVTLPSATTSAPRSTPQSCAARSTSASRAACATLRNCAPMTGVVRLPKVPMSKGVSAVSAMTIVMAETATRSSSATACASEVRMFWPISVLPVYTVTRPSSPTCSQAETSPGSASPPPRREPDSWARAEGTTKATRRPPPRSLKTSRRPTSNR